ncbi:hypothetical protein [Embleya sp. AB8]|uniref:hypothetical protein n=1 Tax=Embleya sp. AB8 TaxID=3156304 RepID=UPI003C74A6BE
MMNRQNRTSGRGIRRAGPVAGVLATVGIALGAWVGVASASGSDTPKSPPASVTSVAGQGTTGDRPAAKAAPAEAGPIPESVPRVLTPGNTHPDKNAGSGVVSSPVEPSAQLDPAGPKVGAGSQVVPKQPGVAPADGGVVTPAKR